ncbi:MAG: TetR family transcriptional regulator [Phenylobacterium sp.]|nr:TetR family transcriptional regulator [Phenylobacterium sp.]
MTQGARDSQGGTAERLVAAGVELARDQGLPALTARALAERAAASPSALNYHLGGREALLARVLEHARAAAQDWRIEKLAGLADEVGAPGWVSPAGTLAALIGDRVTAFRAWSLLLAEFEAAAEAEALEPPLAAQLAEETAATEAFWRTAAQAVGIGAEHAAIWADLAIGLTQLLLSDEPLAVKAPWIFDSANRLHARLQGHAPHILAARRLSAAERLSGEAPPGKSARRLLDAALQIIAEKGPERLTQREVAAAAGLSLAATTYFFRTKADLVSAAFHELHRQVSAQALAASGPAQGLLGSTLEDSGERATWRVRAMEALQLASARDAALAPISRQLRATRGATSIVWLRSEGLEVDGLDAFIFSTAMSGVVQRTRFAPPGRRREEMAESHRRLLRSVFGWPAQTEQARAFDSLKSS